MLMILLERGGGRKRPAESGIGFGLAPARAWRDPAPPPASLSVRQEFELAAPQNHGRSKKRVFSEKV